jgi:hypothetical protein
MVDVAHHHHDVKSVHYENEAARLAYLRGIYAPHKEEPQAFRSPGTFLAEFVFNGLDFKQIVNFLKSDQAPEYCAGCMDERVILKKGGRYVTSHEGCGAAGLVFAAIKADPKLFSRLAQVVGEAPLRQALEAGNQDEVGILWSMALAEAVGADYAHLPVDHGHHYTTMAVLDAGGCFLGNTPGKVGERSFVISNTEFLGNSDRQTAYDLMIQYGFLALQIARGSHSTLSGKTAEYPFTLVVTRDGDFDQALFTERLFGFLAKKKADGTDYAAMNYEIEYLDEARLRMGAAQPAEAQAGQALDSDTIL